MNPVEYRNMRHRDKYIAEGRTKATVYLTKEERELLKIIGDGVISDGVRNLIVLARQAHTTETKDA